MVVKAGYVKRTVTIPQVLGSATLPVHGGSLARVTERSYCGVTATLIAKLGEKREMARLYCVEFQEYGKIHAFPLQE